MQNAFLHGVSEEVSGLDCDTILGLSAWFWNWRVFHVLEVGECLLLWVRDLFCWPEVLLVAAELGVAVLDKGSFARIENGTLVVGAIISDVA